MRHRGCGALTPPFPACGAVRGPGCEELQARPRQGEGRDKRMTPSWRQNRASSKKQNLDLYSSCSWPAHDSGPSPTQRWPSKKLGKAGQRLPSGQCMELRKVSLQDTGDNGRAKALGSLTCPSPAPHALGPDRRPAAGAASFRLSPGRGDGSQAGLWGRKSKGVQEGTCECPQKAPN